MPGTTPNQAQLGSKQVLGGTQLMDTIFVHIYGTTKACYGCSKHIALISRVPNKPNYSKNSYFLYEPVDKLTVGRKKD